MHKRKAEWLEKVLGEVYGVGHRKKKRPPLWHRAILKPDLQLLYGTEQFCFTANAAALYHAAAATAPGSGAVARASTGT